MIDMAAEEKAAFAWSLNQNYSAVASRYARILAEYIRRGEIEMSLFEKHIYEWALTLKPNSRTVSERHSRTLAEYIQRRN